MHEALRQALAARAVELSQRVLDRMYENPFWMERYGERGRKFADEDSLHHVRYLDQAIAADDAQVFERYARWLRTVLVSRGMCSEHLAENFRLLSQAIGDAALPDAEVACRILQRGDDCLRYEAGQAAQLEQRREQLVTSVRDAVEGSRLREDDARYLVSYLVDATATGIEDGFLVFAKRFPEQAVASLTRAASATLP